VTTIGFIGLGIMGRPMAANLVKAGGPGGNRVLELKAAGMLGRQFAPGFRIDLHPRTWALSWRQRARPA
jgi:3-hydroxyisobutyrate dehydrogenase-like beta-hydroxyacid dehydrogenase